MLPVKSAKKCFGTAAVTNQLRMLNAEVQLSHILIKGDQPRKPMIVLHGLLGSKKNWRSFCRDPRIADLRDSYLVELRNHAESNHHSEMNYTVLSDDIIRFADEQQLEKFTILGHSLGGRTSMAVACRFPDRIDGVISIDSAPINESGNKAFSTFTYETLKFMHDLGQEKGLKLEQANDIVKERYKSKP